MLEVSLKRFVALALVPVGSVGQVTSVATTQVAAVAGIVSCEATLGVAIVLYWASHGMEVEHGLIAFAGGGFGSCQSPPAAGVAQQIHDRT